MSRPEVDKSALEYCESMVSLVADGIEKLKGSDAERDVGVRNIREALRMFSLRLLNTDQIYMEINPKLVENEFFVGYIFTLAPMTTREERVELQTGTVKTYMSTDPREAARAMLANTWFCIDIAINRLAEVMYKVQGAGDIENALYHIGIRKLIHD